MNYNYFTSPISQTVNLFIQLYNSAKCRSIKENILYITYIIMSTKARLKFSRSFFGCWNCVMSPFVAPFCFSMGFSLLVFLLLGSPANKINNFIFIIFLCSEVSDSEIRCLTSHSTIFQ